MSAQAGRGVRDDRVSPTASVRLASFWNWTAQATFRTLYVFVMLELGICRVLHHNVTAHPTAEWTAQRFREALPGGHAYRFVIHDRDSIFSRELDKSYPPWERGCCEHQCALHRPIRCASASGDTAPRMSRLSDSVQ